MKVIRVHLKFKTGQKEACLIQSGDWHIGAHAVKDESIECMIERRKSLYASVILMSDLIEAIMPGDKRFTIAEFRSTLVDQIEHARKLVRRLNDKDTVLGCLEGNHEGAASKYLGNVTDAILVDTGVLNLSQTCAIEFVGPEGTSTAFATHFLPSMNTKNEDPIIADAYRKARLRKSFNKFDFDLKMGAHIHTFECTPPTFCKKLLLESGRVKFKACAVQPSWHVVSPAMFATYSEESNYAQGRMFDPTDIGWAEIYFGRDGKVIRVEQRFDDGSLGRVEVPKYY